MFRNVGTGAAAACAVVGLSAAQRSVTPPPPGSARVVLSVDKPTFFLGENVLVHYCLENTSVTPFQISYGGDYRAASRSLRFKMTVTDDQGTVVADPDRAGYHEGGIGGTLTVAPQGHWCESLQLMRYARIDDPGRYTVRVVHDLGWGPGEAPEGQTTLTLRTPTGDEAEHVVSEMLSLPAVGRERFGERQKPFRDVSTLRYPIYLSPLRRLAMAGDVTTLGGIGVIAVPDATRVLIDLLDHANRGVARAAAQMLAMRLPDPALDGALAPRGPLVNDFQESRRYLRNAGWRPDFSPDVRRAARRLLNSSDAQDVVQGAFMIQAVGEISDVSSLSAALTHALLNTVSLPFEAGVYPRPRGAMRELLRAAEALAARGLMPPARPATPGEAALWLVAISHAGRPDGWEDQFAAALAHPIPYMRELALTRLPANAPSRLFDAVGPALAATDVDLKIAACEVVRRTKLVKYRGEVVTIVQTARAEETQLLNFAANALYALGGRTRLLEIMAARLIEPDVRTAALSILFGVFDGVNGWGGSFTAPSELPAVTAQWLAFITAHQSQLAAGHRFPLDDPAVTADLIPRGWKLHRPNNTQWPPDR